ncbi:hypothetical protein Bca52824_010184 [Brassica carinata]|uniref:Uncharacterized protein n=1 Tax=Brassica carinata TaxID=52824 RepID=A0A8X7WCS3_BRACI|nr:hypothetical protein Bca52824_010184 [Brassica carinata]
MQNEKEERFEDWKGREAIPGKHGGIGPASIACVVENLVFVANGFNFIEYFMSSMHYSPATAANMVTNFMGTTFLLTLVVGFIADSFLTHFTTFIIFCGLELMGLILLTFQSYNPKLQPESDETPSTLQATILFTGLYAMALGAGGIKASLPTHGGDQLDRRNPRLISRFFNWFYFSICCGCILAVTIVVSIEESKGWFWSFTTSVGILALALFIFMAGLPFYRFKSPTGSSLKRITKVIVSAHETEITVTVAAPNPLYRLHPSENLGALISSVILKEDNYPEWAIELRNSLQAKQKLGFIDGTLTKPAAEPDLSMWLAANSMIIGWIRPPLIQRYAPQFRMNPKPQNFEKIYEFVFQLGMEFASKCLDKTMLNKNISATEVAETRTFLGLLPIFFSTIAMNCCLAQLSTFSVQQGMIMNRKLFGSFEIPVTSLAAITLILMVLSITLYDYFGKRISSDISPSFNLKRIGLGLALSSLSMVIAAIVETMRKYEAVHNDFNISVLWLMCQYLMLTVADTLAFGGC